MIPSGGIVVDTPGMREIQLLDNSEAIDVSFADIEELAKQCKFSDCKHKRESGCAAKKAIEKEQLSEKKIIKSYFKGVKGIHIM
jgi:ribosome biogenesis GTPase